MVTPLQGEDNADTPVHDPAFVEPADGLGFRIRTNQQLEYSFKHEPSTQEERDAFEALDLQDRERFARNRERIVRMVVSVADRAKVAAGFYELGLKPLFSRSLRRQLTETHATEGPVSYRQAGHTSMQSLLTELDAELWRNAPVVAHAVEFGASMEAGISGGAKVGQRGFYGITGLGLTLAYDPSGRVAVLEVYQDIEWAKRAVPGYGGLGIFGTALGSASQHDWQKPLSPEKGTAVCMPFVVGCISPSNLRLGTSREIGVGFPGAALIKSDLVRVPLLRIGVSPEFTGFVRIKTAAGPALRALPGLLQSGVHNLCTVAFHRLGGSGRGEQ